MVAGMGMKTETVPVFDPALLPCLLPPPSLNMFGCYVCTALGHAVWQLRAPAARVTHGPGQLNLNYQLYK